MDLCQHSHKAESKGSESCLPPLLPPSLPPFLPFFLPLCSHGGKSLWDDLSCWQNSVSCDCRTGISVFLLAVLSSLNPLLCPGSWFSSKPEMVGGFFLTPLSALPFCLISVASSFYSNASEDSSTFSLCFQGLM